MKTSSTSMRRHGATSAKSTLAMAVVAALFGSVALSASAASSLTTVAHPTMLSHGDAVTGALPVSHPLHVVIALKLRNKGALDAFVADSAKSQLKGVVVAPMSQAQIVANHLPTQVQAQTVANYLTSMGFKNVEISENRMLVTADGTAGIAGRAFLTSFKQVRTHDGRIAFANSDEIRIPAALSDKVQSVLGLQNVHQLHTFATKPRALPANARTAGSVHPEFTNAYYPDEFPTIYGAASAAPSSDTTVGIISEGDLTATKADLSAYVTAAGFAAPIVSVTNTPSGGSSTDVSGQVEWDLDSQTILGLSGGQVHRLWFYNMPDMSNPSLVANFNTAVTANKAKIINVSLGECEAGAQGGNGADAADAIFEIGVAQGQTFSVSTGDSGADECSNGGITPSWPANSQYVVAVAGTNLIAGLPGHANPKAWASETEWTGSGGSESLYEPKPSWQTLWAGTHRGVADVAFDADPNTGGVVHIGPPAVTTAGNYVVGGTSLAAPIFSGLWSRVLQVHPTIGFAGPVIYALNSADFHDITVGDNGGHNIAVGYDLESGRGSMILSSVMSDLLVKPKAGFGFSKTSLTVNFTDNSTDSHGAIATYAWTFGDGGTSTAANPTHVYAAGGTYNVQLRVTSLVGAVGVRTRAVTVAP